MKDCDGRVVGKLTRLGRERGGDAEDLYIQTGSGGALNRADGQLGEGLGRLHQGSMSWV